MEIGKVIKIKWMRRSVGFVMMLFLFWLLEGCLKKEWDDLKVNCYEDKDGDGFGDINVEAISRCLKCRDGEVTNNTDIDDFNKDCCQEEDPGCKRHELEIAKFNITNPNCLDSTYVIIEIKNSGNVQLDNIKLIWDPDSSSKNEKTYDRDIAALNPGDSKRKIILLKKRDQFIARRYLSKLTISGTTIPIIDSLKEFSVIACQDVHLFPPYLSKNDQIKVTYNIDNSEKEKELTVQKDSECISLPENYTSFELKKWINGEWIEIFPPINDRHFTDTLGIDSLLINQLDSLNIVAETDSLGNHKKDQLAETKNHKKLVKPKVSPKVILSNEKSNTSPEKEVVIPPNSLQDSSKISTFVNSESISVVNTPQKGKETIPTESSGNVLQICFKKTEKAYIFERKKAEKLNFIEIENKIALQNNFF